MNLNYIFLMSVALLITSCTAKQEARWDISSPDGKITASVETNAEGQLSYLHRNEERIVIGTSPMGMEFEDATFDQGLVFSSKEQIVGKTDPYLLSSGKKLEHDAEWNDLTLHFTNSEGKKMAVCFRLFDDGLAFNYAFEDREINSYLLKGELTGFQIPANSEAWIAPYGTIAD